MPAPGAGHGRRPRSRPRRRRVGDIRTAGGDDEIVGRATQAGVGLFTGVVVYGAAMGGHASRWCSRSPTAVSARRRAAVDCRALALIGFVVLIVVPQLKYPANPPAVGHGDTIGFRTATVHGDAAALGDRGGGVRRLCGRGCCDAWRVERDAGRPAACSSRVVAIAMLVLPGINEVPDGFPPALLWQFRVASLGTQAVLWTALGLAFGALTQRRLARA